MKFNPKKCPYVQLKKHKGHSIIYVWNNRLNDPDRVRYLSSRPHERWDWPEMGLRFCDFAELDWIDGLSVSCFEGETLIDTINGMKDFDKEAHLKIIHIEFYPYTRWK